MEVGLVIIGIALLAAAIVGGDISMLNVRIRAIEPTWSRLLLAALGFVALFLALLGGRLFSDERDSSRDRVQASDPTTEDIDHRQTEGGDSVGEVQTPPNTDDGDDASGETAQVDFGNEFHDPESGLRLSYPETWTTVERAEGDTDILSVDSPDLATQLTVFRIADRTGSASTEELLRFVADQTGAGDLLENVEPTTIAGQTGQRATFHAVPGVDGPESGAGSFSAVKAPGTIHAIVYWFRSTSGSGTDYFLWSDEAEAIIATSRF